MRIDLVSYAPIHEQAVRAFNQRMRDGGWDVSFSESYRPGSLPHGKHASLYKEYFLALDEVGEVRGAYILKYQDFLIHGQLVTIANYQFPLSEGVIDKRYGMVGVSMILDAQRREPKLYGLGLGGVAEPSARLMKAARWKMVRVPFYFCVARPSRFLRNLNYLRTSRLRCALFDALAYSGLGSVGMKIITGIQRARQNGMESQLESVEQFEDWADDLWNAAKAKYSLAAVRDQKVLNALYPRQNPTYLKLRVSRGTRVVGWAVVLDTQMAQHKYFGDMRLGSIADCFADPVDAPAVVYAASRFLLHRGVDMIVSNQSHDAWGQALRRSGFFAGPSNFLFAASQALAKTIEPLKATISHAHINRGDGDGPVSL